jgi:DNA-binding NtrC family response regulator
MNGVSTKAERPVRVLVVDDDAQMRSALERLLRLRGLETDSAFDGQDALERLAVASFDVVLCDVNMPRMTGPELLDRVVGSRMACQVILMTGLQDLRNAVGAMRRGAFGLIAKPFASHQEVLVQVLDAARVNRLRE